VLFAQTERYRRLSVPLRTIDRDVAAEHKAIFDAVISRDHELATKLMAKHFNLTTDIVVDSLREQATRESQTLVL
jgi:DNA-binding GntR family transcriptional regulator